MPPPDLNAFNALVRSLARRRAAGALPTGGAKGGAYVGRGAQDTSKVPMAGPGGPSFSGDRPFAGFDPVPPPRGGGTLGPNGLYQGSAPFTGGNPNPAAGPALQGNAPFRTGPNLGPYGSARAKANPGNASPEDIAAALKRLDPSVAGGVRGLPRPPGTALVPAGGRSLVPAGGRALTPPPTPPGLTPGAGLGPGAAGAAALGLGGAAALRSDTPTPSPVSGVRPPLPVVSASPPGLNLPPISPPSLRPQASPPVPQSSPPVAPFQGSAPTPRPRPTQPIPTPQPRPAPANVRQPAPQPPTPSNQSILDALLRGAIDKYGHKFQPVTEAGNPYRD